MRRLLNACLEKSNLPANLQSGETADRMLPASKLFNHGAKQAARERGSEQWLSRLYATPQNEELARIRRLREE